LRAFDLATKNVTKKLDFFFFMSPFKWYDSLIAVVGISYITYRFIQPLKVHKIPSFGLCLPFDILQFTSLDASFSFENITKVKRYESEDDLLRAPKSISSIEVVFSKGMNNICQLNSSVYYCTMDNVNVKVKQLVDALIKTVDNPLQISDDLDGVDQCAAFEEMAEIINCNRTNDWSLYRTAYNSMREQYMNYFGNRLSLDPEEIIAVVMPTLLPAIVIIIRLFVIKQKER
jgi:hypothetical protein